MRQVLESLGSPDVVAAEVTAPDLNAAGVLGEGVIATVRAPAASADGTADGIARFVGAEISAGYRDRAWAAKLAQPVSYGVQLQRPDGKVEDATGGEVAPVGGDDDFSVPEPVPVSSQDAAALERLVRDLAASRGDQIERLTLLRPMTLAVVLDVRVHDPRGALCKAAAAYTAALYPPKPRPGVAAVADGVLSLHGGPDESAWGFYAAPRAGEFSGGEDCVGEDASIRADARPVPARSGAACEQLLRALRTDAAARSPECEGSDRHAWMTATITNTAPDEIAVRCVVSGLDAAGAPVWSGQDFLDPASIGNIPGGQFDLDGGQTITVTWQVTKPPTAHYNIRCPVDRSSGG